MKLIYHTRGDSSPQGKSRVYFTGHPADMPVYMSDIFADILKTQNCAIYYDEEPLSVTDQEDLLRELEQMQLIVIPVTSRFLYQPNRARDVEFSFAMEHHIPVLPLMQEDGLESSFNEQCGDLQMLNKHDPDPTALPYEEKLEKFLASVLVGDEMAEKVRAAFDAYVFLSYRKKDRKYAQELMKLIHKNDFCRDIAIWYDEFLTPGENFNDAIAYAMGKCQLFTLAVTPNIVEPGNYVMSLEYPEAKKSGKPILPVELVPTDKEVLQKSFRDIPPCADAHDESALYAALLEAVQKLAIRENDGSLEHNFFIGLAYLNGIDVEVDRSRALSLITGAAEDGLPEAMEKLVAMYRGGEGVERNYYTAVGWQEKLVNLWQVRYRESGTERDGLDWVSALWTLGDYQQELAELSSAKQTYQQMQNVSNQLVDAYGSLKAGQYFSASHNKLGDICHAEGKLTEAKENYMQNLELSKQYLKENGTAEARHDLLISYNNLGNISKAEGSLDKAKDYYLLELELSKQLLEESGTAEARRDLSLCYSKLGEISEAECRLAEAKDFYLQSLHLTKQLVEELGTVHVRRDLAVCYGVLGIISETERKLTEAQDYYQQGLEILKQLVEETGTVQAWRDLSVSYERLGGISEAEGNLAGAKEYYLQGLKLRRQLVKKAKTVQARRDLAFSYNSLGELSKAEGRLNEAVHYYLQSFNLRKQLAEETGTVQARRDLSVSYNNLGNLSKTEGRLAEAREYYLQSLELRRQLAKENGTVRARRDLSFVYKRLGALSGEEGDSARAQEYFSLAAQWEE